MSYRDPAQLYSQAQSGVTGVAPVAGIGTAVASPTTASATMDSSVSDRVTQLTQQDSGLNRAAIGVGMRAANRRGLINSSIGTTAATGAVLDRAIPIASQEASQQATSNVSAAQLAAAERERLSSSITAATGNYSQAQSNTLNNENIPAATRAAIQQSNTDTLNATLAAIQRLYGTNLAWGTV